MLVVTTTAETFGTILCGQPQYLSSQFDVFLSCAEDRHAQNICKNEKVPLISVSMSRGIAPLKDLVSVCVMIQTIRRVKPNIIHSYTPKAGLVAMLAAWLCRVPVRVHTFTGLVFPSAQGFRRHLLVAVDRLVARLATVVVPESNGVRKDLISHGIIRKPHQVIGHGNVAGVDTAFFCSRLAEVSQHAAKLAQQHLRDVRFAFCYVGRINRDKGFTELMRALEGLPEDVALLVVGEVDAAAPPSEEVLSKLRSDERVRTVGFQQDVRPFIVAADVLVLPSYREGFPNVVLQALALERPVIVTDVSGANEITLPGENGWIVPVRDAESLRGAMQEAIETNSATLAEMGRKGRERVVARHERSVYLEQLVQFYGALLEK